MESPSTTYASDELHFTEEDIRRQLAALGYHNVPDYRLKEFARDLAKLVDHERSRTSSRSSFHSDSLISVSDNEPYHYTRRVPLDSATGRGQQPLRNYSTSEHTKYGKENLDQNGVKPSHYEGREDSGVMKQPDYSMYERQEAQINESREQESSPVKTDKSTVQSSPGKKVVRKRKVVRKIGGQSQVFDESITESEADEVSSLQDQFQRLPVRDDDASSVTESESTETIQQIYSRRPHSARPDLYPHRPSGDEDSIFNPQLPRSFIRPSSTHPHTKNLRKTDPVTRYRLYRQSWNTFKVPGEKSRKELRWAVREQMLQQDEVYQPRREQRVYVPNNYVVPTDKKRQALRWEIRTELAHGQMPPGKF